MFAPKPVTSTYLKEMIAQYPWEKVLKITLVVLAIFLIIEAYPLSLPGTGPLPILLVDTPVFILPSILILLPHQKSATNSISKAKPVVGRPVSNMFSSANLALLGHLTEGPRLLHPKKLMEMYKIPPLSWDNFWGEEGYNIPSSSSSASSLLNLSPSPLNLRTDFIAIHGFFRGARPSARTQRNNPSSLWDRKSQLERVKISVLRIVHFGTILQQKDIYVLITHYLARRGISSEQLEKNGRLLGAKALPNTFQIIIDPDALVLGQVIGILSKGKEESESPTFALFLGHSKKGFECISGFRGKRLITKSFRYDEGCIFLDRDLEKAFTPLPPLDSNKMQKISAQLATGKQKDEEIAALKRMMENTRPIQLTQLDKRLIYHPFFILWVIPQYKEKMVLGIDITEAVVTKERDAQTLREWCAEKKIQMAVTVEEVKSAGDNFQEATRRKNRGAHALSL